MIMTLDKSEVQPPTTYLSARQKGGVGSKSITIYGATPAEVLAEFQAFIASRRGGTQPITGSDARDAGMTLARG